LSGFDQPARLRLEGLRANSVGEIERNFAARRIDLSAGRKHRSIGKRIVLFFPSILILFLLEHLAERRAVVAWLLDAARTVLLAVGRQPMTESVSDAAPPARGG
jgi:hypothetical protein